MLIIHIHKYESDLSKKNKDIEEKYYNLTASLTGRNFVNLNDYWSKKIEEHLDGKRSSSIRYFTICYYSMIVSISGWINSAINPFIYAFYSADFRLAFWRLTCRKCFKSRTNLDPSNRKLPAPANWKKDTTRT